MPAAQESGARAPPLPLKQPNESAPSNSQIPWLQLLIFLSLGAAGPRWSALLKLTCLPLLRVLARVTLPRPREGKERRSRARGEEQAEREGELETIHCLIRSA